MAAVVSKKSCPRLLSFTAGSLGIIMLAVLMVPGFSNYTAAALTIALLAPLLGQRLLTKFRPSVPFTGRHKAAFLMTIVDTGFMALALLLMPGHGTETMQTSMAVSVHNHGPAMASGAGTMAIAVLIGWVVCTMIVAFPELHRRSYQSLSHAVCSVCMTLAMGVMAL
jgi:hypothetical protein